MSTWRARSRLALAWLVAGVAALAAWNALFPEHRRSLVAVFDPAHVHGLSKALVAPLAAVLLVTARSLARGSRRAWQIAVAVLAVLLVLHVGRRFGEGAVVTGVVVVALVARRADFGLRGDPASKPRLLLHAAIAAIGVLVYGLVVLWVNRLMADQPYTPKFALSVLGRAVAGMSFHGARHLNGPFANWFPVTAFLLGWGAVAFLLAEWLAPWRYRLQQGAHERRHAAMLVRSWGADTLAPFALRADKSYFFTGDGSAFLAYRVVGGVAVVSGDPIGAHDAHEELVRSFVDFAHERGWRVAILGAAESSLESYRALGLRALYHGDEAVVETASFSLDGRAVRKVRQSVSRLERAGYTVRVLRPGDASPELCAEIEAVACEWRCGAPERGFTMALDTLFGLGDDEAVLVVGFDESGSVAGVLHFCISHPGSALSLSTMPRRRAVPNGFTEWLICEAIGWARAAGFARVSLNFSPFAALLAPGADLTRTERLQALLLRRTKGRFQLDSLLLFNRKFLPAWQPAVRGLRAPSRPAARRGRRARSGVVPPLLVIALGLVLAGLSTVAINGGYALQHTAASRLSRLRLSEPLRSLRSLAGNGRWTAGFLLGIGGWAVYVAALRVAPLSLVQAASAGGIAVLALGVGRLRAHERVGVGAAIAGLVMLGLSLPRHPAGGHASTLALATWLAASAVAAGVAALAVGGGAGLGTAAGVLYAAGDVATKAAVAGGVAFVPALLAAHGLAFVCMQLAFQRGSRLATAGLAVVWTNALPIVAGTLLFAESLPGGWRGSARLAAFALVLVGAAALALRSAAAVDAGPAPATLSID